MKKFTYFLFIVFLATACASTKELSTSRSESRKLKNLAEQDAIKKAVESRKYVIKVNRLYPTGGGMIEMIPSSNFLIVNGPITSISLGYVGRSYGIRPITGINLNGRTTSYKMESNDAKGTYNIQMSVAYGSDKFDVYLSIGTNGFCNISLNNAYIQYASYQGTLTPLKTTEVTAKQNTSI
jgi:hypothetical protein